MRPALTRGLGTSPGGRRYNRRSTRLTASKTAKTLRLLLWGSNGLKKKPGRVAGSSRV